jgi:cytochrome P450
MTDTDILRPAPTGWKADIGRLVEDNMPTLFRLARAVWPIARFGNTYIVTRYDNVREVFLNDPAFMVPYAENLRLIIGGEPFFLGMADTQAYRRDTAAMRAVVLPADLPRLAEAAAAQADTMLDAACGRLDVVDFTRQVTFGVLCPYFGITPPDPADGDLRVWATRLFEYQFTYTGTDAALHADAARMAPRLRAHIDSLIAARKAASGPDDVLGRCLARQRDGEAGYADRQIRSALIGFLVGGLPQPPMVLPQALEQLLQRPTHLCAATGAAAAGDSETVARYLFEALRFDPLAPGLQRRAMRRTVIGAGQWYQAVVPKGATVLAAFASAMRDPRRVADPETFNPNRPASDYLHFGYGLHRCFGEHINRVVLPATLARLLRRNIRRASGPKGHLTKRGIFADQLWVEFKP